MSPSSAFYLWSAELYALGYPLCWLYVSFCCGGLTTVDGHIGVADSQSG